MLGSFVRQRSGDQGRWRVAAVIAALLTGCGVAGETREPQEKTNGWSSSRPAQDKAEKLVALELSVEGMPTYSGSATYGVLEQHPSVRTPIVLSITGGRAQGDFITLDLMVTPPSIAGVYPLISTMHGELGSYASARLDGVEFTSDDGEVIVTSITPESLQGTFSVSLAALDQGRAPLTLKGTFVGKMVFDCSTLSDPTTAHAAEGPEWVRDEHLQSATCRDAYEVLRSAK